MICCIIIWHHYCNPRIFSQLAYASVTFFVFFSGFITQYAYADTWPNYITQWQSDKISWLIQKMMETPDNRMAPNVSVCILLFLEADKDKMAGPKANLISFFVRRIGRVLPIYYAIHFAVLRATGQAWTADFQERINVELGSSGQRVSSVPP